MNAKHKKKFNDMSRVLPVSSPATPVCSSLGDSGMGVSDVLGATTQHDKSAS